ncbi:BTB/POZ domain and ankyrin repeat-containing protein NH5.2 [Phragmites australis]|uniref:BTB/POZ domain and ankyrin repeat-containing protein NH5.2 n=1 Tax=Phragmites australis TaxID=29695 RepID=UPI002D79D0E3|nr:BTB/POZ domain and ankyrin repeat-containing protein NH5.2 [Phragmites australis]
MSSEDSLKSLSLDYLNLLINGQAFSDVAFSVEGRLVHAHRCVLAARSLFFRKLFCGLDPNHQPPPPPLSSGARAAPELVIPVSSIRYEVLVLVLQFLYSGQASVAAPKSGPLPGCGARGCWHTRCGAAVDLALDTLAAARSFGVEQLALLVQKQLESMVKEASVDDVMKVLMASRKFEMQELWATCSHLVARSGLSADLLAKHLPIDVVAKIEEIRSKSPVAAASTPRSPFLTHHYLPINAPSSAADRDHKIRRMRRALDAADIELVKLMVMGEGLDLDDALAVHYAVQNCNRDIVKALLELGAADVNSHAGPTGKTPLHLAAEMVSPDMVSVLLDHHADPNARTLDGVSPLDVLRSLTSEFLFKGAVPGLTHIEPNKLRLCLELVQSAVMVTTRAEGAPSGGGGSDGGNFPRNDADDSLVSLTMNSTLMYQGQEMAAAIAGDARKGNGARGSPSNLYFPNGFP